MGKSVSEVVGPIGTVVGVGKGISDYLEGEQQKKQAKNAAKEADAKREQLSLRQEATYRTTRHALQGAIEDFYKQKGWELPKHLPGAFTTRPLPGDAPLYPGYDVNPSEWTHKRTDGETDVAEETAAPEVDTTVEVPESTMPIGEGSAIRQVEKPALLPTAPVPVQVQTPVQMVRLNPLDDIVTKVGRRYG